MMLPKILGSLYGLSAALFLVAAICFATSGNVTRACVDLVLALSFGGLSFFWFFKLDDI